MVQQLALVRLNLSIPITKAGKYEFKKTKIIFNVSHKPNIKDGERCVDTDYRTWERCPLETKRWMEVEIELVALVRAWESVSRSQTSTPWTAASWAIPDPI